MTDPILITEGVLVLLVIVMIWSGIWKAIALWHAARHKQTAWFVVLCIFNTIGILEILYLCFWQRDRSEKKAVTIEAPKLAKKAAKKKKK